MSEIPNLLGFKELLNRAKKLGWCTRLNCTTCGAKDLRPRLKKFSRDEIIEGLKNLSKSFIDDPNNTEILIFCFYTASLSGSGFDLVHELEGYPISVVLHRAIYKTYRDSKANYDEPSVFERQKNKIIRLRERAKKHIWGAIRRKDYKAIDVMLSRGID